MRFIFYFLVVFLVSTNVNCKAQTIPLDANYWEYPQGAYIKDTFNEMNKFEGTWQYTNGTDTLTIVLQKKIHVYDGEYYQDFLIGEYRFVSNGIGIVNTIPNNSLEWNNTDNRNVQGGLILPNNMYPVCSDCSQSERRFQLSFYDPDRIYLSLSLVLRYIPTSHGTPEKMTATLISNGGVMLPDENSPTIPRVPYDEYLMIKQ